MYIVNKALTDTVRNLVHMQANVTQKQDKSLKTHAKLLHNRKHVTVIQLQRSQKTHAQKHTVSPSLLSLLHIVVTYFAIFNSRKKATENPTES